MTSPLGTGPMGDGGPGVSLIEAADSTVEVTDGGGPIASLRTVYGPPHAAASTIPGDSFVTSTPPGAAPTYPDSHIYLSLGSPGSPIAFLAGTYLVDVAVFVHGTNNNSQLWWAPFQDGFPPEVSVHPDFTPVSTTVGVAGSTVTSTGPVLFPVPVDTTHWFDLHVAFGGGSGSVNYFSALITIFRIS